MFTTMPQTMRRRLFAILAIVALLTGPIAGHHSIAGAYDRNKPRTLHAVVKEFRFINPHPIIVAEVQADGHAETWTLEMDNRWELAELGFHAGTLAPGDEIVVGGTVSRREPHALYVLQLERPSDGFTYEHYR